MTEIHANFKDFFQIPRHKPSTLVLGTFNSSENKIMNTKIHFISLIF